MSIIGVKTHSTINTTFTDKKSYNTPHNNTTHKQSLQENTQTIKQKEKKTP